jgi:hypothetical protein
MRTNVPGSLLADKNDWEFISKNKPTSNTPLTLDISFFLGYLKNGETWYSKECYESMMKCAPIPWNDVVVTISIDDNVVYTGAPVTEHRVIYEIQDSQQSLDHAIEISLQGVTDDHSTRWSDDLYGTVALKVSGTFENLPLNLMMSKFGHYYTDDNNINVAAEILGQNGIQKWTFKSPFYDWLHQNREHFLWELTYPSGYKPE